MDQSGNAEYGTVIPLKPPGPHVVVIAAREVGLAVPGPWREVFEQRESGRPHSRQVKFLDN